MKTKVLSNINIIANSYIPKYHITNFELFQQLEIKESLKSNFQNLDNDMKIKSLKFLRKINKNIIWIKKQLSIVNKNM